MIKRVLLTTFSLFLTFCAYAQDISRDSLEIRINELEKEASSLHRDSTLAFFYNDMCEKCIWGGDNRAEVFLNRFKEIYKDLQWEPAKALYFRASAKWNDKKGNYEKAIEEYYKAIKILEENPADPKHLTYTYILAGFIMTNNANEAECIKLFKKAEPFALKEANKANIIWIYDYLGDYEFNLANDSLGFNKALDYYKKVESFLPFTNVSNQRANNLEGLAKTYWKLGDKATAMSYFQKALNDTKGKEGQGFNKWNIFSYLSYMEEEDNNLKKAISYSLNGLEAARDHGYAEMIVRSHMDLYNFYKNNSNVDSALFHFEKFTELTDSLGRNELNAKYKELESKYQYEQQETEIKELENGRLQLIGYVILSMLILGLVGLLYYRTVNKRLKIQNQQLNDKNEEIKLAIEKGSQQERKRVANDLHDGLATKISAMKWRMEASEPTEQSEFLVNELEKLYTDVRLIAHNMASQEFHLLGLIPSIEKLITKLNLIEKTTFKFENKLKQGRRFDHDLGYQLYCIVLELSTNIMKHANATTAVLTIKEYGGNLILSMSDDGQNTNKGSHTGMGLSNLRSRVKNFNGNVMIRDEDGFEVYLEIPIV